MDYESYDDSYLESPSIAIPSVNFFIISVSEESRTLLTYINRQYNTHYIKYILLIHFPYPTRKNGLLGRIVASGQVFLNSIFDSEFVLSVNSDC